MKLPILYSRSTSGKVSTWEIEYTEDSYRTISGFQGMKLITSEWTKCQGKSYNSTAEQTEKESKALWKKKIEGGMFEDINSIDNEIHFEPMLAKDWDKEKTKIKYPIYSQPKLDGIRCIIKKDGMWTRNGKEIISAPHIFESLNPLFKYNPNLILDGELYADKLSNDFNTIISLVRKTKPTIDDIYTSKQMIEYHIYDLPSFKDTFVKRYQELMRIDLPEYCKVVHTTQVDNLNDVEAYLFDYLAKGYEGQILRLDLPYENKRSKSLLKHKEFQTEEFIILSVTEGIGKLQNKAGTFQIKTKDDVEVDVTINGTHEFLEDLWKRKNELIGKECTVRFFGYTEDKSLRFPKVIDIDRWKFE